MAILFPGRSCRFYSMGACAYEEDLNPGHAARLRCVRLLRLEKEWDAFLERAEAFGLSEEQTARIWNARCHAALEGKDVCPQSQSAPLYAADVEEPEGAREAIDCRHVRHGACLLAMPRCLGVCPRFLSG